VSASKSGAVSPIASVMETSLIATIACKCLPRCVCTVELGPMPPRCAALFGRSQERFIQQAEHFGRNGSSDFPIGKVFSGRLFHHRSLREQLASAATLPHERLCRATLGLEPSNLKAESRN
jgi:hypothetical protein